MDTTNTVHTILRSQATCNYCARTKPHNVGQVTYMQNNVIRCATCGEITSALKELVLPYEEKDSLGPEGVLQTLIEREFFSLHSFLSQGNGCQELIPVVDEHDSFVQNTVQSALREFPGFCLQHRAYKSCLCFVDWQVLAPDAFQQTSSSLIHPVQLSQGELNALPRSLAGAVSRILNFDYPCIEKGFAMGMGTSRLRFRKVLHSAWTMKDVHATKPELCKLLVRVQLQWNHPEA